MSKGNNFDLKKNKNKEKENSNYWVFFVEGHKSS